METQAAATEAQWRALTGFFGEHIGVVVAFSGGVDSSLVLDAATAALGPQRVLAVTAVSPAVPARDLAIAEETARHIGATHRLLQSGELSRAGYRENQTDRCFHCKSELYSLLGPISKELGWPLIVNGTNRDDLGDFRPGLQAAAAAGVRAPLVEVDLGKGQVRELARYRGLPVWDRPAAPCLSSRIPFGSPVTAEKLRQVEQAEAALYRLGFRELRVRHHGQIARIELGVSELGRATELAGQITKGIREAGFQFAALDLAGIQSGIFNPSGPSTPGHEVVNGVPVRATQ